MTRLSTASAGTWRTRGLPAPALAPLLLPRLCSPCRSHGPPRRRGPISAAQPAPPRLPPATWIFRRTGTHFKVTTWPPRTPRSLICGSSWPSFASTPAASARTKSRHSSRTAATSSTVPHLLTRSLLPTLSFRGSRALPRRGVLHLHLVSASAWNSATVSILGCTLVTPVGWTPLTTHRLVASLPGHAAGPSTSPGAPYS